jgi:hypothetical protein
MLYTWLGQVLGFHKVVASLLLGACLTRQSAPTHLFFQKFYPHFHFIFVSAEHGDVQSLMEQLELQAREIHRLQGR